MRYRPLSGSGDYTIGQPWYVDVPQAVGQAVLTRLRLWLGEWFVDITDGTAYPTGVLGERYGKNPDAVIKRRILGTFGVQSLISYSSQFDGQKRVLTVNAMVQTIFSVTPIQVSATLP